VQFALLEASQNTAKSPTSGTATTVVEAPTQQSAQPQIPLRSMAEVAEAYVTRLWVLKKIRQGFAEPFNTIFMSPAWVAHQVRVGSSGALGPT
jgi:hypothetical protein